MKLKHAVKIAAIKAAVTQLGGSTDSSGGGAASVFRVQRLSAAVQTLNRIIAEARAGNFLLFLRLFDAANVGDGSGVEDGVVLSFFRTLTNDAGVAESAATDFTKSLNDIGVFSDNDLLAMAKGVADGVRTSEAHHRELQKSPPHEVLDAGDTVFSSVGKVAEDTTHCVGQKMFHLSASYRDPMNIGDTVFSSVGKVAEDTTRCEDQKRFHLSASHIDPMNIEEAAFSSVIKPIADTTHCVDQKRFHVDRTLSELTSITDAGSLNSQDYSDITYFMEGYVGTSIAF